MRKNTILDILAVASEKKPETIILRFLNQGKIEEVLSYEELWQKIIRLSAHLENSILPHERALILLPSGTLYLISLLACFTQKIIAVPIYPPQTNASINRILSIVEDCNPKLILSTSSIITKIRTTLPSVHPLNQIQQMAVDVSLNLPNEPKLCLVESSDIAYLQYTSGSTSTPKGIKVTHGNMMANFQMLYHALQINCDDIHVSWLPLFHDMGLIAGVFLGLYSDNPVIFMQPNDFSRNPIRWLKTISDWKATVSGGPNFAYDMCCQQVKENMLEELDLSSWRLAYNAAEPVQWRTLQLFSETFSTCGFRKNAFFPAYGMAETTLIVSGASEPEGPQMMCIDRSQLAQNKVTAVALGSENSCVMVRCGHTHWGDQVVKIVNPKSYQECHAFEIGEIWVKGSHVTAGIFNNPDITEKLYYAETQEGDKYFFKTGDLGFFDRDKNLYITGRLKDLLIIHGQNFYPSDIEKVVEQVHPALIMNGVAAFMAEEHSGIIVVAEISKSASKLDNSELKRIAEQIFVTVNQEMQIALTQCLLIKPRTLPKTSSGKVQRQKIKNMFYDNQIEALYAHKPSITANNRFDIDLAEFHSLQEKIIIYCQYWIAAQLKCEPHTINPDQSILSFGLDSLNLMDLLRGLENLTNRILDISIFYNQEKISELAAIIAHTKNTNEKTDIAPHAQTQIDRGETQPQKKEAIEIALPNFTQTKQQVTSSKNLIYLRDFHSVCLKPHIPQEITHEYIIRLMATSKCIQDKITDPIKATRIYREISEKMQKFGVSSKYISKRQVTIFPENAQRSLEEAEIPLVDLFEQIKQFPRGSDLGKRMEYYDQTCTEIFSSFYPEDAVKPDDLIHVTCAGYLSPSPAQKFLNKRRWLDVTVTHSYHMGCYGAFPAVRMGAGFLSHAYLLGQEKDQVDIVHTELLFTHLDISKYDANNLVNMTLFADGFIKYSAKHGLKSDLPHKSLAILSCQDVMIKDTLEEMTWKLGNYQFDMYLSERVPVLIRDSAVKFLKKLCFEAKIDLMNEKSSLIFAIHPGGPKILNHLQELFQIEDWQLKHSRHILYENGNMSSATIPHIWQFILEDDSVKPGTKIVSMAFGPGLSIAGMLLEKV